MKSRLGPCLLGAAALFAATASTAATQTCVGSASNDDAAAVATMVMENHLMKSMVLLISRATVAAPGHGAAEGSDIHVKTDLKLTMGDAQTFDGLGMQLTFLNKAITAPIDLKVVADGVPVERTGLAPNPDGTYSARLGGGPLNGNLLADALDRTDTVRVRAVLSSARDQILINADVPIGTSKQREGLGLTAMDEVDRKSKAGCPAS